ncbi:unnamed protein product, partial [Mesorhabditis belari]|uniref:Uncharacterized protein n=1 Tax=Mesorhabditis belari TaxID=2138241 RepID=A0AAF3ENY1_9BILA
MYLFDQKLQSIISKSNVIPYLILFVPYYLMIKEIWIVGKDIRQVCALTNHPARLQALGCLKLDEKQMETAMTMYRNLCPNGERECDIVNPFISFPTTFNIVPGHSINTCDISDNLSSLLKAIMCFLSRPEYFSLKHVSLLGDDSDLESCKYDTELTRMVPNAEEWLNIALIRDPLERTVSTFLKHCRDAFTGSSENIAGRCHGCDDDLECFLKRQHLSDLLWVKKQGMPGILNKLLTPQNWQCEFRYFYDLFYLLRYDPRTPKPTILKLRDMWQENGVPKKYLNRVLSEIFPSRNHEFVDYDHYEFAEYRRLILNTTTLYENFMKQYFYDFILFRFPPPKQIPVY